MISIDNKKDCCGCTACVSTCPKNAISLIEDDQGFTYPHVNQSFCVNCGLCDKVCPVLNSEKRNKDYKKIYALRLKDESILQKSSSGGAFYAIASYVIQNLNGIVFGVKYDEKMEVRHAYTETLDGLKDFQGSKYVQSNIKGIYEQVRSFLCIGRNVLFTGTPCQVMALKLFLKIEYENLICVDNICHSVPSPRIFKEYLEMVNSAYKGDVVKIDMRNKKKGWSHAFYYYYYYFSDGTSLGDDKLKFEHWGKLFFSGLITRPSCNACRFTSYRRAGDITVADFWDDSLKRPEAYSPKGTSLLIVSTDKGEKILRAIEDSVDKWILTEDEAYQPCLKAPIKANPQKDEFWKYYHEYGFKKAYNKYFKIGMDKIIKNKLKKILKRTPVYSKIKCLLEKFKYE